MRKQELELHGRQLHNMFVNYLVNTNGVSREERKAIYNQYQSQWFGYCLENGTNVDAFKLHALNPSKVKIAKKILELI